MSLFDAKLVQWDIYASHDDIVLIPVCFPMANEKEWGEGNV